jgi:hypothetical protein
MPRDKGELYLVDREGVEYGFSPDMAMHRDLYAVMRDGEEVEWKGVNDLVPSRSRNVVAREAPSPEEVRAAHEVLVRAEKLQPQVGVADAARSAREGGGRPTTPVSDHEDPALRPDPPQPQPPESLAADLLSPEHSVNQDGPQDRHQAERYGYRPDATEERERHDVAEYGEGDVGAEADSGQDKIGTEPAKVQAKQPAK